MRNTLATLAVTAAVAGGCATTPSYAVTTAAPVLQTGPFVNTNVDVTLANTGRRTAARVAVSCKFYSGDGVAVETGSVFFNNLAPGASETNTVVVTAPHVARGDCAVGK